MTTDAAYNEDILEYIIARHRMLGVARKEAEALLDAKNHDKFTAGYTTEMRDKIAGYLGTHFSNDANMPDLTTWTGANTPQRIYQAAGGDGLVFYDNYTSGVLTSTTMDNGGDHYTRPPTIVLTHVNGTGAEVRAIMGEVIGCVITDEGDDYTSAPTVTISSPDDSDGTQATMAVYRGKVMSVTVDSGGTGFVDGDTVTIGGPDNGSDTATADVVVAAGVVTEINVTHAGSGYTGVPSATLNSTAGTGATTTVVIDDSVIAGCYIIEAGAGYTTLPTATMSGGGGSGATFGLNFNPGIVKDFEIVAGGSGYDVGTSGYPTITITPTAPATPAASTNAQDADDAYTPAGWTRGGINLNDTDQRFEWRSERTGSLGDWGDFGVPTLSSEYSST